LHDRAAEQFVEANAGWQRPENGKVEFPGTAQFDIVMQTGYGKKRGFVPFLYLLGA
jgi:hypothetical protein